MSKFPFLLAALVAVLLALAFARLGVPASPSRPPVPRHDHAGADPAAAAPWPRLRDIAGAASAVGPVRVVPRVRPRPAGTPPLPPDGPALQPRHLPRPGPLPAPAVADDPGEHPDHRPLPVGQVRLARQGDPPLRRRGGQPDDQARPVPADQRRAPAARAPGAYVRPAGHRRCAHPLHAALRPDPRLPGPLGGDAPRDRVHGRGQDQGHRGRRFLVRAGRACRPRPCSARPRWPG